MATLTELVRARTSLDLRQTAHLQRLVGSWGPVADLCFSDLLLFVPVMGTGGDRLVVVGQVRPTTSQTVYRQDLVGDEVAADDWPLVHQALRAAEPVEADVDRPSQRDRVHVLAFPVRHDGQVVAVVSRESSPTLYRSPGELERTYLDVFARLARMIQDGTYPFADDDASHEESPRVGDGAIVLDAAGRVVYASPNAVSALHKLGVHANAEGMRLGELGLDEVSVRTSMAIAAPVTEEIERRPDVSVIFRCLPLLEHDAGRNVVTGALVLLRDISDLRRRDRLLVSMDATIQEIHHRVKNNLQTISSLLRLQGRRLDNPEAKAAVEESVRRVRSIALVHETLSRATGDDVDFNEIVRPLVRMVEDGLVSAERQVRVVVTGDAGHLPARVATPIAVVLNELLQNAIDHGFPTTEGQTVTGTVTVDLANTGAELRVVVRDDGAGLPDGFRFQDAGGLGLSIVRSLVQGQVGGHIDMRTVPGGHGTEVRLQVPVNPEDAGLS